MPFSTHMSLPHFDDFNEIASDDRLFARVLAGAALADLPPGDVFMVAHQMLRDTPYGPRPHYELTYVLSGHVVARVGEQEVHLLDDSLFLATPSCAHCLVAVDHDAIVVVLCLRPALFESDIFTEFLAQDTPVARTMREDGRNRGYLVFSDVHGDILYRSIRALLREYEHAGGTASLSVRARTLLLLAQLSEIDTYSFYGLDQQMMDVVAYVREHCAEVSVASLADRFGYSETYFSQLVHQRCGMRARELIVAERLRLARELLATTTRTAQDIASTVGYESYSHFNRIFRQNYHITPAQYRAFASREVNYQRV